MSPTGSPDYPTPLVYYKEKIHIKAFIMFILQDEEEVAKGIKSKSEGPVAQLGRAAGS